MEYLPNRNMFAETQATYQTAVIIRFNKKQPSPSSNIAGVPIVYHHEYLSYVSGSDTTTLITDLQNGLLIDWAKKDDRYLIFTV